MAGRPGITLPGAARRREVEELARRAEAIGCDAIWILDTRRDPYLVAAAAISATRTIEVGTDVAVAFARSPTVTAAAAWDLSEWSTGRFTLGLGSQVGPTLAMRFGVVADHPALRMSDYVAAVRACFGAFASGSGGYDGRFYRLPRPAFQPGSEPDIRPPHIYVAAVNPRMAEVAGACADGLAVHSFTTKAYLRDVLLPAFERGAANAGRPVPKVLLQLVVAPDREIAAKQMAVYTVPTYRRVLDHAGLGPVADQVIAANADGRRDEARALVDQHYLDRLSVVVGEELRTAVESWSELVDRIAVTVPWYGMEHRVQLATCSRVLEIIGRQF